MKKFKVNGRKFCELKSPLYISILSSKYNGDKCDNGDIRIGNSLAVSSKTNLIYKLPN